MAGMLTLRVPYVKTCLIKTLNAKPRAACVLSPRFAGNESRAQLALGARRQKALQVRRVRAAANDNELEGTSKYANPDDPHQILRISAGTTFLGMLGARREAREKAAGDDVQLAKIEGAFRTFVDKAEQRFKDTVEATPDDPCALYSYANFLQTIEDWDEAIVMYNRVLNSDPSNELYTRVFGDVINNYAMILHEQKGDMEGADALYQRAYDNNPEDVDILFNWATLKKDGLQDMVGAIELVDKVVALKPDLAEHPLVEEFRQAEKALQA